MVAAMMIAGVAAPRTGSAQAHAPWLGTWSLSVEKSTYSGAPPYKRGTMTVEPWQDGIRMVSDLVGIRGGVTHLEWTGRFDGMDYPVQGIDEALTYAYSAVDARTFEMRVKADGRLVGRSRATIAPDGRTLTTVTSGVTPSGRTSTSTTVYEKR
jgi:hypothetical protein